MSHTDRTAKSVNNMHLQNIIMQLRKISSHPFLFDWPFNHKTGELVVNQDLVNASGKMLLLQRLLDALFERGHKVLIFSQFTTMLDVIVSNFRRQSS
jgi:ATP-dependent DNA helicase